MIGSTVRPLRQMAGRLAYGGMNLLFPPRCARCEDELSDELSGDGGGLMLCERCRGELGPSRGICCPTCGAAGQPNDCVHCRRFPPKFDAGVSLGIYRDGLRDVVLRMKRPAEQSLAAAMGKLLVQRRHAELVQLEADRIVPIPMYWVRRIRRGTNSPEIVAGAIGRHLGLPVGRRMLVRRRNTKPQADLRPQERFQNVRGAFQVRRPSRLGGARILLVDDILTTGATCSEAARMLKRAGASSVAAVVIARAEGPAAT